ncbi:hypothetical protein T265_07835 [Opisthorchis viverrini]|uniref:Uncharacterized protein n=1 Tax=Opisthorchis viverrini TaxID=6198 RepID=A0A074ZBK3_OPIVI|nr:hypothetical protein T265_07835 [Opisthorchis viverrini]KER24523.1 hypothetical protein T265_07835 [Opisthorchis viverrini]
MPVANGPSRTRQNFQKAITTYAIYTKHCTTVLDFVLGVDRPCAPLLTCKCFVTHTRRPSQLRTGDVFSYGGETFASQMPSSLTCKCFVTHTRRPSQLRTGDVFSYGGETFASQMPSSVNRPTAT